MREEMEKSMAEMKRISGATVKELAETAANAMTRLRKTAGQGKGALGEAKAQLETIRGEGGGAVISSAGQVGAWWTAANDS